MSDIMAPVVDPGRNALLPQHLLKQPGLMKHLVLIRPLTGGAFYTGKQYTDVSNDYQLPSFTTFDAGARYRMKVSQNDLTLRMNVSNLANKDYWLNSHYLGDPRTVQFSAQLEF